MDNNVFKSKLAYVIKMFEKPSTNMDQRWIYRITIKYFIVKILFYYLSLLSSFIQCVRYIIKMCYPFN